METQHVLQPLDDFSAGIYLKTLSETNNLKSVSIAVAYARMSGLKRLEKIFKDNGSRIEVIVGVDQGGTTREALRFLSEKTRKLYVFHHPRTDVTFHPKIFIIETDLFAYLLIGSVNLTSGGMFTNVEGAVVTSFKLPNERAIFENTRKRLFDDLKAVTACCVEVTSKNMDRVMLLAPTESEAKAARSKSGIGKIGKDKQDPPLFSNHPFPSAPAAKKAAKSVAKKKKKVTAKQKKGATSGSEKGKPVLLSTKGSGFYKRMSKWDVHKKSSPGQIQIPLRFLEYFPAMNALEETRSGAWQSDVEFDATFLDTATRQRTKVRPRLILYVPAPNHKRQNKELRLTFHDRSINPGGALKAGDYLELKNAKGTIEIRRIPSGHPDSRGKKAYDQL